MSSAQPTRVVVLISGSGSNLQALIEGQQSGQLPIDIVAVISNRPAVRGLLRAEHAGIPAEVLDHTRYDSREAFDAALRERIDHYRPELVVLAGFMRILTPAFTRHYEGRMLNIHPSLLPKYQGLHTHQRVLEAGEKEHGVTVHFVTAELDGGPPAVQARIPVLADDDAESLAARVQRQEHVIYPLAVKWFAEGRLRMESGQALLNNEPLGPNGYLMDSTQS
ncbi:phosphoribosylglycinamide formyltransferase [Marinimicrobium sp. C6131]|uniref:phosphoribosylglycinamide formyltransferase n=1 Tax=Marinimicrobium sp. C6131 TaxID=3022676 RepID=UPI00223D8FF0|nr:phosphoribosylglycinamide formyltransferase [Marinimicrobium sp. C6131]UZJ44760.1 phosphoribosylglycinamide formyltransferase [Marinimicrobium sp. C6131]